MLGKLVLLFFAALCLVSAVTSCAVPNPNCLLASDSYACSGKVGDFALCAPDCQEGKYASCTWGKMDIRDCADGWYYDDNWNMVRLPMVFDPSVKSCRVSSKYCPRPLDYKIAGPNGK